MMKDDVKPLLLYPTVYLITQFFPLVNRLGVEGEWVGVEGEWLGMEGEGVGVEGEWLGMEGEGVGVEGE